MKCSNIKILQLCPLHSTGAVFSGGLIIETNVPKTEYRFADRGTVLVVDDDELTCRLMRRVLKTFCDITVVTTGEQALVAIEAIKPDLVLLDIMLEGMSGYEVCQKVRQNKSLNLTKIILVSGMKSIPDRLKGYDVGADDFITKPFNNDELAAKVRVFLRLKRSEEVGRLKTDLLELFGHETRTPLTGIIAFADMISAHPEAVAEIRDLSVMINQSGHQLLEFVRKTLLICELKKGRKLNFMPGAVSWHLGKALAVVEPAAKKRAIEFDISVDHLPEIDADWQMIQEVFGYLLDNAVKFSADGETVTVKAAVKDDHVLIDLINIGEGIALDWQQHIFDEFAVRDINHHQKGQGLSLAISRRIIRLHDGEIKVRSRLGEGAVFTISLPVNQH